MGNCLQRKMKAHKSKGNDKRNERVETGNRQHEQIREVKKNEPTNNN